jgi:CRISPR-associated protein Cas2
VFECIGDPAQWTVLKVRLEFEINKEKDSLKFYYLGSNWKHRVEHLGAHVPFDQEGLLLI